MPSYSDLAKEAILSLKERTGSSLPALKKYIETNHADVKFAPHLLRAALKKGVESGKFVKVKASYKLSPDAKKEESKKKPVVKKPSKAPAKKPAAKKTTTKKKPAAKKTTTKKKPAAKKTTTKKKPAAKKSKAKK